MKHQQLEALVDLHVFEQSEKIVDAMDLLVYGIKRKPLVLPKTMDAGRRILARDQLGERVWRLLDQFEPTDTVVEIGKGFGLIGDGSRLPLQVFRGAK